MKRWKTILAGTLAAAMLIPAAAAAPSHGTLSDLKEHWARDEIQQAIDDGWVDGYPDGTFKPEKTITRAEFTKMLLDATHLTPDSETVAWMKRSAKTENSLGYEIAYQPKLADMNTHWLARQGWLDAALYSGLVVPNDYNNKNFRPEKAIARYEIALMTDRALGLVYPATQPVTEKLPFTDNADILDWMKGYVNESVKAGVLKGYPDGSFRPNKTSTRAEAVVMVQRMLNEMEQGLDPDITVVAQYRNFLYQDTCAREKETDRIQLQAIDDVVYASLTDMYTAEIEMMNESNHYKGNPFAFAWWPVQQKLTVFLANTSGTDYYEYGYQMGSKAYDWEVLNGENTYCAPVRSLYGELMIPVCDLAHSSSKPQDGWKGGWDPKTNTLTLPMFYSEPPQRYT